MSDQSVATLVERLLAVEEAADLDAQDALRHADFVEEYPQSRERVRGRDNVRRMLETHPSPPRGMRWRITPLSDEMVLAEIAAEYGGEPWWIAGFFSGADGLLTHETAYFGPAYPAPDWRAPWVERITADDWLQDAGGHGEVTRETAQRLMDLSTRLRTGGTAAASGLVRGHAADRRALPRACELPRRPPQLSGRDAEGRR